MKKIFTLAAMAAMTLCASAQTESAFMDAVGLLGEGATTKENAVSLKAGAEMCKSASVTMKAAWDDGYILQGLATEKDAANKVVIDGVTYDAPQGVQGQSNPKPADLLNGGQNTGAVFEFDVTQDGVLYVFGKLTGNKSYYVWEGDVKNGQGMPVAFTMFAQPVAEGSAAVKYTLPGDKDGYYVVGSGYDNGTGYATASLCCDVFAGDALASLPEGTEVTKSFGTRWTAGNALGVVAFPVYKDAEKYFVNACGSKMTSDGFVFVPGATTISAVTFTKGGGETGINDAVAAKADVNAPIYNLAGQRVNANFKGIAIQNGKKFIAK